ncbi:MAG: hypothetical protein WDN28_03930 [Chthoniobacter sp.]
MLTSSIDQIPNGTTSDGKTYPLKGLPYYLPKGVVLIDGTFDDKAADFTVKISTDIRPDTTVRYRLENASNAMFEDRTTFAVDSNGLLQSIKSSAEDKSTQAIADVVSAAGSAMTFEATLKPNVTPLVAGPVSTIPATAFHYSIDPYDPKPITTPWYAIKDHAPVQFTFTTVVSDQAKTSKLKPEANTAGIIVRLPIPFTVTAVEYATAGTEAEKKLIFQKDSVVLLPDVRRNYLLPIDRVPFVKNETNVVFANGMIQSLEKNRPSVVAGIAAVPKTVLSALAPIPLNIQQNQTNLLKARVTHSRMKRRSRKPGQRPNDLKVLRIFQQLTAAAEGYIELGMPLEANEELEQIDADQRSHTEGLALRVKIYFVLKKWELMQIVAKRLARIEPENVQWTVSWAYATSCRFD